MTVNNSSASAPEDSEEYIGYTTHNIAIAFCVLEVVFVTLRFIARQIAEKKLGINDILMLPSLTLCLALNATALVLLRLGHVGYHVEFVAATAPEALVPWAKGLLVTPLLFSVACALPKIVILMLYLRIFNEKKYRNACYAIMGLVILVALADIVATFTECIPISKLWDPSIDGHCANIGQLYRLGTLPNVVIDLLMLVLPLPVVWKLHVSRQVRIGLTVTFLTGSIGMLASILRCVAFFQNDPIVDGTWTAVTFLNWSIIEPGVYLIAACLPCYRPLFKLIRGETKPIAQRVGGNRQYAMGTFDSPSNRTARMDRLYELNSEDEVPGCDPGANLFALRWGQESDEQRLVNATQRARIEELSRAARGKR